MPAQTPTDMDNPQDARAGELVVGSAHAESESYFLDTHGFTSLYLSGVASAGLSDYFEEFMPYIPDCRFVGCSHVYEASAICGVRQAVERDEVSIERYENYCQIYEELKERESTYR